MTCNRASNMLDSLDNGQAMPLAVRIHLFFCPACRALEQRVQRVHEELPELYQNPPDALADEIMALVALEPVEVRPLHQSLRNWLIPGIAIIAYLVLAPIAPAKEWFLTTFGFNLLLPMSITLGAVLTIYAGLFVASHMDKINEFLHSHT